MDKAKVFAKLREMSGKSLTTPQIKAGDLIIEKLGLQVFADLVEYVEDSAMNISKKGLDLIKDFEGTKLKAYYDSVGIPTIGHGTIKYPNGKAVAMGDVITLAQAESYMLNDLKSFEAAVNGAVKVPVTQNQYDAMVSLAYNIGVTGFTNSTLVRKLNAGDVKGAADQFLVWNKGRVKGVLVEIKGLTNRRVKERALFLS